MSTSRVPGSSSVIELVRALRAQGAARAAKGSRRTSADDAASAASAPPSARDLQALRSRLADLVTRLDTEDREAVLASRRPVVQEILLWEFGADFRQHPEFGPMLDSIERAFDADSRFLARFTALIRDLQRDPP